MLHQDHCRHGSEGVRVLVVLGGNRYQKTVETLPHSGLEYRTIHADKKYVESVAGPCMIHEVLAIW